MKTLKLKDLDIIKKSMGMSNPKVYYIPKHVMKYINDFGRKIKNPIFSIEDVRRIITNQEGTIKVYYMDNILVTVAIVRNDDPDYEQDYELIGFGNHKGTSVPLACHFKIKVTDGKPFVHLFPDTYVMNYYQRLGASPDKAEAMARKMGAGLVDTFVKIDLFMSSVKIETIAVPKKCKSRKARVYNKSDMNLTVVGSDWYQSMVLVGDSFVTGHWRNQPYGPERSLRRLIYIEPHKRGSYTRRAKKQLDPIYA